MSSESRVRLNDWESMSWPTWMSFKVLLRIELASKVARSQANNTNSFCCNVDWVSFWLRLSSWKLLVVVDGCWRLRETLKERDRRWLFVYRVNNRGETYSFRPYTKSNGRTNSNIEEFRVLVIRICSAITRFPQALPKPLFDFLEQN